MTIPTCALSVGAILLVVAGCGDDGSDDAGDGGSATVATASVEDFCAVLSDEVEPEIGDDNGDWLRALDEVGVPESMGEKAREGRDLYLELGFEYEGRGRDSFDPGTLSADDDTRIDAFWAYGTDQCTLYSEDE